jgi:hypothetical protein
VPSRMPISGLEPEICWLRNAPGPTSE